MAQLVRVALADDHTLFRRGLGLMLDEFPRISVIIKAENGEDLLEQMKAHTPDVVLMDLKMPDMDGLTATIKIRKMFPQVKVIALSMYDEKKFIIEMIKSGAHGYLFKNADPKELMKAIDDVVAKDFYFNKYITEAMMKGWANRKKIQPAPGGSNLLTKRELQVLKLICQQFTTTEIAEKVYLSPRTVENYRHRLLEKLEVRNTAGLVIYAIESGMIDIDPTNGGNW